MIQILEQLALLQLAKEHLPGDIVDILKRLSKADNIPFNQLYYIVENCVDHYYSKVIETFVALLKCQFVATTRTPASSQQDTQDVDWPDAIPVEIPPQPHQDIEQNIHTVPTRCETDQIEIPQLETDPKEEEQSQDLQTYLTHHNTYEESQNIHKEYRARLLELDDDRYYQEIDHAYQTYGPLPAQDYIPVNQAPGPHHTTQELMQIFGKGEVRHTGKSFMDIDLLEQEQDHCKAESSKRLRKHNVWDRGM